MKISLLLITILLSPLCFPKGNTIFSSGCKMHLENSIQEEFSSFMPDLKRLLKENKNFSLTFFDTGEQIGSGALYIELKKELIKETKRIRVSRFSNETKEETVSTGSYPPCKVTITVKRSQGKIAMSSKDSVLLEKTAKRDRPRLSKTGSTRCIYALKDALLEFPVCE